mmetsp:Transcript_88399/g.153122  ORF Transcript_88399/g.153122 Transcript_88399/m.153122 type:complete len:311 (+) Transcript_88399:101-1033(+)
MQTSAKMALTLACMACARLLKAVDITPSSQPLARAYQPSGEASSAGTSLDALQAIGALLLAGRPSAAFHSASPPRSLALQRQAGLRHRSVEMRTSAKMLPQFSIKKEFKRLNRNWFIAADPGLENGDATEGTGALKWGVWRRDPGLMGVDLSAFEDLEAADGRADAGWDFDPEEWWLEEYGRIMPKPIIPIPNGKYLLPWLNGGNAGRAVVLTIKGDTWSLDKRSNARLKDVTHLPCRSARYTRVAEDASPTQAKLSDFPVLPGRKMPPIEGYEQADYAVLFVEGLGKDYKSGAKKPYRAKPKEKAPVPS